MCGWGAEGPSGPPSIVGRLGLNLITGPGNAGKVALLLRRYLQALSDEPYLIVPNRSDVEQVERQLLELQPALLAGAIGTFDDLFTRIARGGGDALTVASEAQRALIVRRALAGRSLNGLGRSARFGGLAGLADGRIEELAPGFDTVAAPALAHLERTLFSELPVAGAPPIDGALRFFEAAGTRGALELVGEELLTLIRGGVAPEWIGIVCPSLERWQAPLETALGTLGVPYAIESYVRLDKTAYGQALLSLLRFAWLGGTRADLYAFLRSPYSAFTRQNASTSCARRPAMTAPPARRARSGTRCRRSSRATTSRAGRAGGRCRS